MSYTLWELASMVVCGKKKKMLEILELLFPSPNFISPTPAAGMWRIVLPAQPIPHVNLVLLEVV